MLDSDRDNTQREHPSSSETGKSLIGRLKIKARDSGDTDAAEPSVTTIADSGQVERGKGGEPDLLPPLPPSNAEFVASVVRDVAEGASGAVCSVPADPETSQSWQALMAWTALSSDNNNYLNCSSFRLGESGELLARKENFSRFHFLLLDDVGTKVDRQRLGDFVSTWEIETSPGNFQIGIRLAEPLEDQEEVARLQNAVVQAGLCDGGAKGVCRWSRLPHAINGKAKYRNEQGEPFRCHLTCWFPDVAYTVEELAEALSLDLSGPTATRKGAPSLTVRGDDIFTPPPLENPVLTALKERGLYKRALGQGTHDITCPWLEEHTDAIDSGTAYFEPCDQYPHGGFCCQHSHGNRFSIGKLLDHLGIAHADAEGKPKIRLVGGALARVVRAAERVLAASGSFYQSGGMIMAIRKDVQTGAIETEVVNEQSLTTILSGAARWERFDGRQKAWVPADPSTRIVQMLLKGGSFKFLPVLNGIARQPFFCETDFKLVTKSGYDVASGIYADFDSADYPFPDPTREAAETAKAKLVELLREFHFAQPSDRSATLSAMLTGVVRPTLPLAPAFNITASAPGSGKSYLARTIAPFATPAPAFTMGYPVTAEEASKQMLAALLQGPPVIVFDDMQTDWRPFAVMNRALTSEAITERVLGVSRSATVSTRTLILGTGNNVGPVADMCRRVITIRLYARTENPATLSYEGRPVDELKRARAEFVTAALTIIRAWIAAGKPKSQVPDIASFDGPWSDLCRQPLLWLEEPDPAISLIEQVEEDPSMDPLGELLTVWHDKLGERPATLRKLIDKAARLDDLDDALQDLPINDGRMVNRSKLGWYLKKNMQRIVGGLELRKATCSERNAWCVVRVQLEGGKGGG